MMPNVLQKIAEKYEEGIDVLRGYCLVWNEKLGTKHELHPNERFSVPPFGAVICHESAFISRERYYKLGGYKMDFKYTMDLDLFIRMYKDKTLKSKIIPVCVDTFRTGGASSSPASIMEQERKRLILENGGNAWDVFLFINYHRVKYMVKITLNTLKQWIRK